MGSSSSGIYKQLGALPQPTDESIAYDSDSEAGSEDEEDLEKRAEVEEKTKALEAQAQTAFEQLFPYFPGTELWRFFMEESRRSSGPKEFDKKECGYMAGLYTAFSLILTSLNEKLTVEMLINWHNLAISTIVNEHFDKDLRAKTGFGAGFGLKCNFDSPSNSTVTKEGLIELAKKFKDFKLFSSHAICNGSSSLTIQEGDDLQKKVEEFILASQKQKGLATMTVSISDEKKGEDLKEKVQQVLETYEKEMAELKKLGEESKLSNTELQNAKLAIIANTIQNLEVLHPFEDANCRTVVMLLSIKLLLENNFMPAILSDPNKFDGFSIQQLVDELRGGMATFVSYSTQNLEEKLSKLTVDASKESSTLLMKLKQELAKEPDIALAQINWIFLKLQKGELVLNISKQQCLDILKSLYIEKYQECLKCPDRIKDQEVLNQIAEKHDINKFPFANGKTISEEIAEHELKSDATIRRGF